jgi:glycosyltransferase involved in cell wall biosynthesis
VAFRAAGGLRESVLHGTTGLLADDLDEFTRHLAWVLLNRHLRERLGEAARAHAARFTWPQTAAAFARVLDEALDPAGTRQTDPALQPLEEPAPGRAAV